MNRRRFITTTGAAAIGFGANSLVTSRSQEKETMSASKSRQVFWPDRTRLVISISMQFETGAQPQRGAGSLVRFMIHSSRSLQGFYFTSKPSRTRTMPNGVVAPNVLPAPESSRNPVWRTLDGCS